MQTFYHLKNYLELYYLELFDIGAKKKVVRNFQFQKSFQKLAGWKNFYHSPARIVESVSA